MQQNFSDRLISAIRKKRTPLVVGLDPRLDRLPTAMAKGIREYDFASIAAALESFCKEVVDAVSPLVAAVKPQAAFFELLGPAGMTALYNVVQYAKSKKLIVIMDAKRGDIGSTAEAYALAFLGDQTNSAWGCDCLTVNPYLGDDSLVPFVSRCSETGSGIFVLVRTSNPGGRMLQEQETQRGTIYELVADHVQKLAKDNAGECGYGAIGAVVGATHPRHLTELRARMPNTLFLVPGVGAQGATAEDIGGAFDEQGLGAVINSSRAIIFAYARAEYSKHENNWQAAVEQATRDTITQIAEQTSAGQLMSGTIGYDQQ